MKSAFVCVFLLTCCCFKLFSQQIDSNRSSQVKSNIENHKFTKEDWSARFNKDFAKLIGASGENVSIGSFASLDLVNPKFNFNGAIPIAGKNSSKPVSILSINAQGIVDEDNIAYIFSNRKKPSSGSVALGYHFGLRFKPPTTSIEESELLALNEYVILSRRELAYDLLEVRRSQLTSQITKFGAQNANLEIINQRLDGRTVLLIDKINQIRALHDQGGAGGDHLDSLNTYTNELSKAYDSISSNLTARRKNQFKVDSLNAELILGAADSERQNLINDETRAAISKVRNELFFYKYSLSWWTIDFAYNRSKVYLFDSLADYHQRISPKNFNLFSAALSHNFYSKDQIKNITFLVKVGVGYTKTTNTDFYDTTPITQEFVDKDSLGTTTRKTVTNYSVYTDKIKTTNRVRLFVDGFLFLNSSPIGIHIFPENFWVSSGRQLFNCGAGIISSFRNRKKDSPVLNLELYGKFYEIGVAKGNKELSQNFMFGIKFSAPFNFF